MKAGVELAQLWSQSCLWLLGKYGIPDGQLDVHWSIQKRVAHYEQICTFSILQESTGKIQLVDLFSRFGLGQEKNDVKLIRQAGYYFSFSVTTRQTHAYFRFVQRTAKP